MIRPILQRACLVLVCLSGGLSPAADRRPVIRTAAELTRSAYVDCERGRAFDLVATVSFPFAEGTCTYAVQDETGAVILREGSHVPGLRQTAGDRVRITGRTGTDGNPSIVAISHTYEKLGSGPAPEPVDISATDFYAGRRLCGLVRLTGRILDVFRDEVDPAWIYIVLKSGSDVVYAVTRPERDILRSLLDQLGAEVSVVGVCNPYNNGERQMIGLQLLAGPSDFLTVVRPAASDPFDVPELAPARALRLSNLGELGRRHVVGRVVATWHGNRALLRTSAGQVTTVEFIEQGNLPPCGAVVKAVGFPETDLYRLNLSRAIWRMADATVPPEPPPEDLTADRLMVNYAKLEAFNAAYHGRRVRLSGTVRHLAESKANEGCLDLECGKYVFRVDASACPSALTDVVPGCEISVAGICLMETPNWYPGAPFPHISGITIAVCRPDAVRILARPPWWTPGRLLALAGLLAAVLLAVLAWNAALRKRAERRGRELAREQVAHVLSDFKVDERTHLAVELHDSLSQVLTGVSFEVETAAELTPPDAPQLRRHLGIATRALDSCRLELRNCLWDLRSNTLEAKTMDEAIRLTLGTVAAAAQLHVRFNVPRGRFTDSTTHTILRIVRELAANAVRHGQATVLHVAGCIERGCLLFSVADNGCGFDPDTRPGIRNGHFGLDGIRERIERFDGAMSISSSPGKGTKVAIRLKLPQAEESEATA